MRGSIEQDADLVLMIYNQKSNSSQSYLNQKEKNDSLTTELIIAKQRNGPTGSVKFKFDETRLLFSDIR